MEFYISQIIMMATNFAPRSFAFCNGQTIAISHNTALFSLIGTIYGGDGRTTCGLPDLRGRSPIHFGTGPGLSNVRLGQRLGNATTTLSVNQMPNHSHHPVIKVGSGAATKDLAKGNYFAQETRGGDDFPNIYTDKLGTAPQNMASNLIQESNVGGSQPFNNYHPALGINFCITMMGIFPSRS